MSQDIGSSVISEQMALRPCHPCKSRKRRCGKELPECALCLRTGRRCRYESSSRIELPKAPPPHQSVGQDVIRNNFPATYFLDQQLFNHCQISIQKSQIVLPIGDFDCLKNDDSVHSVAKQFFQTIHLWLPILSRGKFYGWILHQKLKKETDLRILVTCMHILLPRQCESSQSRQTTYSSLKHQLVSLEQAGILTITVLQSMILLSFYELGHGIYPAAFLTVGTCARYAVALGLDRDIFLWDQTDSGWAAMEERHRAWWAVVILERHMNIDSPSRHLCTPDPSEKDLLPLSDDDWNNGVMRGAPYTVSAPTNSNMGKFARLAQATHLLSRVMRHISDTQADAQFLDAEKSSLDQALRSLLALTVTEEQQCGIAYCSPVALVSSALLSLHSFYRATSPAINKEQTDHAYFEITELTSKVTLPIARRLKERGSLNTHTPCPLLIDWIYRSAIAYHGIQRTEDTDSVNDYVQTMRNAMEELGRYWGVGGILLFPFLSGIPRMVLNSGQSLTFLVFYINMLETRGTTGLMPGISTLSD